MDATVAVLAGGSSKRMGKAKAATKLAGHSLISYPIAAAQAAGLERVVVAKPGSELPQLYCPLIEEPAEPLHPLLGIVTALRELPDDIVAVACDMPFLDDKLLAWLASHTGTTVVEAGGRLHPLLARYSQEALPALEEALDRRDSLTTAVRALNPMIIGPLDMTRFGKPELLTFNANTPEDLAEAEHILEGMRALARS